MVEIESDLDQEIDPFIDLGIALDHPEFVDATAAPAADEAVVRPTVAVRYEQFGKWRARVRLGRRHIPAAAHGFLLQQALKKMASVAGSEKRRPDAGTWTSPARSSTHAPVMIARRATARVQCAWFTCSDEALYNLPIY